VVHVEVALEAGAAVPLDADHEERAIYVVDGEIEIAGERFEGPRLLIFRPGDRITVRATRPARMSSSAAPRWKARAISGGISSPPARSASSRPRPTGRPTLRSGAGRDRVHPVAGMILACHHRTDASGTGRLPSMTDTIERLTAQIRLLQGELEAEVAIRRARLRYTLRGNRAVFEREILRAHRALRVGLAKYIFDAGLLSIITAPAIYALIVPFVLLDIFVTVYQWICFPAYGIEKVRRADYLVFDRHATSPISHLLEKLNCAYCSYCNGLLAYCQRDRRPHRGVLVPDQATRAR